MCSIVLHTRYSFCCATCTVVRGARSLHGVRVVSQGYQTGIYASMVNAFVPTYHVVVVMVMKIHSKRCVRRL